MCTKGLWNCFLELPVPVIDPNYKKASENLNLFLREKEILNKIDFNKIKKNKNQNLLQEPFIKTRVVEKDLVSDLYKINSLELNKTEGGPLFGNGKTTNYQLFENTSQILNKVKHDLIEIMIEAVNSEIYIAESFLNILRENSGSYPHTHIMPFDKNNNLAKN